MNKIVNDALAQSRIKDQSDPLHHRINDFAIPAGLVYLDGNSLGPLPKAVKQRVDNVVNKEWGEGLIKSWNTADWIDLPKSVGQKVAKLIGVAEERVICADSISVNLFKLLSGALRIAQQQDCQRHKIVTTNDNFPTDGYIAQGLAELLNLHEHCVTVELIDEADILQTLDTDIAVLLLTQVNFRTGKKLNIREITKKAHEKGILVIWDLAHSAGIVPLELDNWQVDFAVGCGYKYLNGGPGAPAFMAVAERHIQDFKQPLSGWMGHAKPFDFVPDYQPKRGIQQSLVGTPSIISMSALDEALNLFDDVTMAEIYAKSIALSEWFLTLLRSFDVEHYFELVTPLEPDMRGGHLALKHEHAYAICQAWIAQDVIADFRAPNILRIGFSPLFLSYEDMFHAVHKLSEIMENNVYCQQQYQVKQSVT